MSKCSIYIKNKNANLPSVISILSEKEKEYASQLKGDRQEEFITSRSWVKTILARHLNCSPATIIISKTDSGKPFIKHSPIHFSVSHSNKLLALGISTSQIGVDIQEKREIDHEKILTRLFPEYKLAQPELFYKLWTQYEALVKALGKSIFTTREHPFTQTILSHLSSKNTLRSPKISYHSNEFQNYMFSTVICGHINHIEYYKDL